MACEPFDWIAAEFNLAFSVRLILYHPQWNRSCADCMKYSYIEGDGPNAGTIRKVKGSTTELELRSNPNSTPCISCAKIPKSAPSKHRSYAIEMTPLSRSMLDYYCECRAIGQFPDDPIVRWYAAIIRQVEDGFERNSVNGRLDAIMKMLAVRG